MKNIDVSGAIGERLTITCNGTQLAAVISSSGLIVDPLDGARRLIEKDAARVATAANCYYHKERSLSGALMVLAQVRDAIFDAEPGEANQEKTTAKNEKTK